MKTTIRSAAVVFFLAGICSFFFIATAPGASIDISGMFDRDTVVDVMPITDEPDGNGYRLLSEVFATTTQGQATNIPASGVYTQLGRTYQFGPFGTTSITPNTWIVPHNTAEELTLEAADQQPYSELTVLHTGVGFGGTGDGTITVTFDDSSFQTFTWDVVDSNAFGLLPGTSGSQFALNQVAFYYATTGAQIDARRSIYTQTLEIAPSNWGKSVTSIKFDSTGNGDNGDVNFGIYAIDGAPVPTGGVPNAVLDISADFNADTLATSNTDSAGTGYRGTNNEKFLTDMLPANGTPLVLPNGVSLQFGDYSADNTILMQNVETKSVGVSGGTYGKLYVVHSAVGFNAGYAADNGTVTIHYTDGSNSGPLFWDLADNDGNNCDGRSIRLVEGTLWRFDTSGNWPGRGLWYQEFDVNPYATIDHIEFSTSTSDTDADFGIYAVSGVTSAPVMIDIPAGTFNGDTLATSTSDSAGVGYRQSTGKNEKFLTDGLAGGNTLRVPNGPTFELADFESNNTILLALNDSVTIDIADGAFSQISVLHSAVGHSTVINGLVTVYYTDGSSDSIAWDAADNGGAQGDRGSFDAVTGLTLRQFNSDGSGANYTGRQLWYQTFVVDSAKTIDSLKFDTLGITDSNNDAVFGIYALSGIAVVPEPSSVLLTLAGLFSLIGAAFFSRRRK